MSYPKNYKGKDVNTRQTVMGDFFSKSDRTKKSTNATSKKKATSAGKVSKGDQDISEKKPGDSQIKAVEKKISQTASEKTKEAVKKTSKVVEKKADKDIQKKTSLKRKVTGAGMFSFSWTRGAQRDTEEYRNGYPGKEDHLDLNDNYKFYMNQIPSKPDGDFIDKIHVDWWGDYKLLEIHHGYIQWLFPIRESGLNWHAQELQLHEIKRIQRNKTAMKRILTSYKMMLDFYGMELKDEGDGTIKRAENWRERFKHLNRSFHNYLRITRILKCLGEFGYEHLKKNFVQFVLYEGLEEGTLSNLIDSCVKYWIGVLKDDDDREPMFDYYEKLTYDENLSTKRRNRSPSPPSSTWSNWQGSKTGEKVISKPADDRKANLLKDNDETEKDDKNEKYDHEVSDSEEDSTLYHAISLIDDEENTEISDVEKKKVQERQRRDHELSDSDEDDENTQEESQEMKHWNNEAKKTNEEDIAGGSESYDSCHEADEREDDGNKVADTAEENTLSVDNGNLAEKDALCDDVATINEMGTDRREKEIRAMDCKKKEETDGEKEEAEEEIDRNERTESTNDNKASTKEADSEENIEKDTDLSDAKTEKMDTSENETAEPITDGQLETSLKNGDEVNSKTTEVNERQDEEEKMDTRL